jgi:alpha,alpha-trehalase
MYFDYDFATGEQSSYNFLTTFYPLWAGAASVEQARRVEANLNLFEHDGGPAVSTTNSGEQWDLPYGWAPTTWLAADGMARCGDRPDALRVARAFTATVRASYQRSGTIVEKYNVVTGSQQFQVLAGYRQNVVGFGWTNAVYERLEQMLNGPALLKMPRPKGGPIRTPFVPRS